MLRFLAGILMTLLIIKLLAVMIPVGLIILAVLLG